MSKPVMQTLDQLTTIDLDYIVAKAAPELEAMSGKVLWLTGCAGFLGYYFTMAAHHFNSKASDADQIRVLAIDNYMRGIPNWLNDLDSPNINVIMHDIIDPIPADWPDAHFIIHAASIASPKFYRKFPLETIDANVTGLRHMLDYGAQHGDSLEGLLYFSTSEIYGDPSADAIPTDETYRGFVSCTGPRACYDESKRLGETLCVTFAQTRGVPVKSARPFNNYGPGLGLNDGRVMADFVRDALAGRNIVLLSDGKPTRTFCYVADAIVGYLKILVRGRPGEAYNIGTENPEISMRKLADLIAEKSAKLWGYDGKVEFGASEETAYLTDNPQRRCPDITKARNELDYDPAIAIDDGVERAMTWYYHHRSEGVA
jgi:UDP-glucuronate decarboxylase